MDGSRLFYDAERARIARLVRQSEEGWLFYPPGGGAVSISAVEAERIEDVLVRRLDRLMTQMARVQRRILAIGLLAACWLMAVSALAPAYHGLALGVLMPALIAYVLWEATLDARFRLERRRWLRAEAARLGRRLPISRDVAQHHRRYNLFQLAAYALSLAGVGRMLWCVSSRDDMAAALDAGAWALVGAGWLVSLLAARVDRVHRTKRWLGMAAMR